MKDTRGHDHLLTTEIAHCEGCSRGPRLPLYTQVADVYSRTRLLSQRVMPAIWPQLYFRFYTFLCNLMITSAKAWRLLLLPEGLSPVETDVAGVMLPAFGGWVINGDVASTWLPHRLTLSPVTMLRGRPGHMERPRAGVRLAVPATIWAEQPAPTVKHVPDSAFSSQWLSLTKRVTQHL